MAMYRMYFYLSHLFLTVHLSCLFLSIYLFLSHICFYLSTLFISICLSTSIYHVLFIKFLSISPIYIASISVYLIFFLSLTVSHLSLPICLYISSISICLSHFSICPSHLFLIVWSTIIQMLLFQFDANWFCRKAQALKIKLLVKLFISTVQHLMEQK